MPLSILTWHSRKLQQLCRSSLSAEAQASASAIEELEWCKVFLTLLTDFSLPIEGADAMAKFGESTVSTDAKSLFDSAQSLTSGMKLSERRTAIEIATPIIKDRKDRMKAVLERCQS